MGAVKLFIGNMPYDMSSNDLRAMVSEIVPHVTDALVVCDKFSGRSKGFGFVEVPTTSAAETLIAALHGTEVSGRQLTVNEARAREPEGPDAYLELTLESHCTESRNDLLWRVADVVAAMDGLYRSLGGHGLRIEFATTTDGVAVADPAPAR